jgi:hypothetical protein
MAIFLNLPPRGIGELNQAEVAELLGVSERTFRRWTCRYEEDGEAGLWTAGSASSSGKRVPADRAEEVERLYPERYLDFAVKHFHEYLVKDHGFGSWLHLDQAASAMGGAGAQGAAQRGAPREVRAAAVARDDAASGRLAPPMARRPGTLDLIVTMDDATGAIYSAFLTEEECTASTFRALKGDIGPPGSSRSAPSRPSAAARETTDGTSLCAAWRCAARPFPPASPSPGRDSGCAGRAGRRIVRRSRRQSLRRPPSPTAARRRRRSSAHDVGVGPSRRFITSSVIGVALRFATPIPPENRPGPPQAARSLRRYGASFASGLLRGG